MADYLLIIPLFLAVAIGWWLGLQQATVRSLSRHRALSHDYFTGLDFLISERPDDAIESFVRVLDVTPDTLTAHLALAKLLRKKGEFSRAVALHCDLLSREEQLPAPDLLRVRLALAQDYEAGGLLDRAERLLTEIIAERPPRETLSSALRLLIKLYEKEGEWQQALDAASRLDAGDTEQIRHELAHYCCELAEVALVEADSGGASRWLRRAHRYDARSVRVSLLQARVHIAKRQWRAAIRSLRRVCDQDPLFVSETIMPIACCYRELGRREDYRDYLRSMLGRAPSTTVMLALTEELRDDQGVYGAGIFITEELKKRPSVRGFNRLIDLHIEHGSRNARESLLVLRGLTGQLEQSKPVYRCNRCGFSGRRLVWQCPSCRGWGTTRPIQGLEGE